MSAATAPANLLLWTGGQGTQIEIIIIIGASSVVTQREPPGHQLYGADRCSKEEEGTPVQEVGAGAGAGVTWGGGETGDN